MSIQSMCKGDPHDAEGLAREVEGLVSAGCDLVRLAIPDLAAVDVLAKLKRRFPTVPLAADVHFDVNLALASVDAGADKVRVNPGNIGGIDNVLRVAEAAAGRGAAIRVGVNSGSLEKDLLRKYDGPTARALVESALRTASALEAARFYAFVVSLKSSDVLTTIEAYTLAAESTEAPLHLGVTAAGPPGSGSVRSAVALGALLGRGIGDTVRVSLTGPAVEEVRVARIILESLGLRPPSAKVVSCPTCGRTHGDLVAVAEEVESCLRDLPGSLTVAVMGCEVNGPGEARQADVGLAMGRERAAIFKGGRVVRTVPLASAVEELLKEIDAYVEDGAKRHSLR